MILDKLLHLSEPQCHLLHDGDFLPSPKGHFEDQMSWVRASTILSTRDTQPTGGGRYSRKAGGGCVGCSVVGDADPPLSTIQPNSSCPAGWMKRRHLFLQLSHGARYVAGGAQVGSSPPLAPWAGGLCVVYRLATPLTAERHEIPPAVPSQHINNRQLLITPPWPPSPASSYTSRPSIISTACLQICLEFF